MFYTLTVMLSFFGTNILIFIYSILSKNSSINSLWKVFLIPLIFSPLLYLANVFFSEAWILSNKTSLSIAIIGISNLAIGILVFLLGQVLYLKEPITLQVIAGSLIIIAGTVILNWK